MQHWDNEDQHGKVHVVAGTVWQIRKIKTQLQTKYGGADLVVIDEGSQLTVADAAIALDALHPERGRLLVAGDPLQLAPLTLETYPAPRNLSDVHLAGSILNAVMRTADGQRFDAHQFACPSVAVGDGALVGPCSVKLCENWRMNFGLSVMAQKTYGSSYRAMHPAQTISAISSDAIRDMSFDGKQDEMRLLMDPSKPVGMLHMKITAAVCRMMDTLHSHSLIHVEAGIVARLALMLCNSATAAPLHIPSPTTSDSLGLLDDADVAEPPKAENDLQDDLMSALSGLRIDAKKDVCAGRKLPWPHSLGSSKLGAPLPSSLSTVPSIPKAAGRRSGALGVSTPRKLLSAPATPTANTAASTPGTPQIQNTPDPGEPSQTPRRSRATSPMPQPVGVGPPIRKGAVLFIITPHHVQRRAVLAALQRDPATAQALANGSIEVDTVDKMQGREVDTVIACYGLLDPDKIACELTFLYNFPRWNVALTRARCKSILVVSDAVLNPLSAGSYISSMQAGWSFLKSYEAEAQRTGGCVPWVIDEAHWAELGMA